MNFRVLGKKKGMPSSALEEKASTQTPGSLTPPASPGERVYSKGFSFPLIGDSER